MKMAFVGDSITEGIPGVGYVEVLKRKLPDHDILNYGKAGDTVISLLKRVKKIKFPEDIDVMILEVGVNDILVNVSGAYPLIKTVLNQPWCKNKQEFEKYFREVLSFLCPKAKKLVVVTPLLIGENMESKWNRTLGHLSPLYYRMVSEYSHASLLDAGGLFAVHLQDKTPSDYLSKSVFSVVSDAVLKIKPDLIDKKSRRRGLCYTLDGIHLNSAGANLFADAIIRAMGIEQSAR